MIHELQILVGEILIVLRMKAKKFDGPGTSMRISDDFAGNQFSVWTLRAPGKEGPSLRGGMTRSNDETPIMIGGE